MKRTKRLCSIFSTDSSSLALNPEAVASLCDGGRRKIVDLSTNQQINKNL